jgi:hypothetical protein
MQPADLGAVVRGKDGFAAEDLAHPSPRRAIGCFLASIRRAEHTILATDAFHSACLSSWFAGSAWPENVDVGMHRRALGVGSPRSLGVSSIAGTVRSPEKPDNRWVMPTLEDLS